MPKSYKKQWNPKYLSRCVRRALELLNETGEAVHLLQYAAEHLECTEAGDCRVYRQQLKERVARLRRARSIEPWEYWLLSAAKQILHPIPGTKHSAVTMLSNAINEFDPHLHETWWTWYQRHMVEEPAYE